MCGGRVVLILQLTCGDCRGLFPPFCLFFGVFFPLFTELSAHFLCPDVSQLISGFVCLLTRKSPKISIWRNPPEVLWLDIVRLLWNCYYLSGLLWPFFLGPDSSIFLPQTPTLPLFLHDLPPSKLSTGDFGIPPPFIAL